MIITPIGHLNIEINNVPYLYKYNILPCKFGNFSVLKRYQIIIPVKNKDTIFIVLDYKSDNILEGVNSGEGLYAISFTQNDLDIEIGLEGDINGVKYRKTEKGCCLNVSSQCQKKYLKMNIAWKYIEDKYDVSVWFAADPSIDE